LTLDRLPVEQPSQHEGQDPPWQILPLARAAIRSSTGSSTGALDRGILLTPFHNMALMCPATMEADVDRDAESSTKPPRARRRRPNGLSRRQPLA
jgi:hypothetical protein